MLRYVMILKRILPVLSNSVPVAEVLPGEVERESLSGTDIDGLALEVPENTDGVVGTTKADVELGNLVTSDLAIVGDIHSDSEENLVKACVTAETVVRAGRQTRLRAAVRAVRRPSVVQAILGVVGGSPEVCAVEARVDVGKDKVKAWRAKVVSSPVADGAVGRCGRSLAGSRLVGRCILGGDLEVAVRECGVRETVAELVDGSLVELVEVAVVDEDTLDKVVLGSTFAVVWLVDHVRWAVRAASLAPGERSLSTRVDLAKEDVGDGVAGLLAGNTGPDDRGHVLVLVPVLNQHSSDSVHDNDGVVALRSNSVDESVALVPQGEVVAIALIAIKDNVSLTSIRVCENDACTIDLESAVGKGGLLSIGVVIDDTFESATVAKHLGLDGLERSDKVREVGYKVVSIHQLWV